MEEAQARRTCLTKVSNMEELKGTSSAPAPLSLSRASATASVICADPEFFLCKPLDRSEGTMVKGAGALSSGVC